MDFRYPIFLDLAGKRCVVIGEGSEMLAKIRGLVDARAHVLYVNPTAEPAIAAMAATSSITWARRRFEPQDLAGCFLAITSQDDNSEVFRLAEEQNVLCNAVDDPKHCRFSFGSIHRDGDLTIAISTNGWAPALAVRLRQLLEREIGPEYGEMLAILRELRPEIASRVKDFTARRELWYRIVDSDALEKLRAGQREEAMRLIRSMIEEAASG